MNIKYSSFPWNKCENSNNKALKTLHFKRGLEKVKMAFLVMANL